MTGRHGIEQSEEEAYNETQADARTWKWARFLTEIFIAVLIVAMAVLGWKPFWVPLVATLIMWFYSNRQYHAKKNWARQIKEAAMTRGRFGEED